jgi:hypothetical protein
MAPSIISWRSLDRMAGIWRERPGARKALIKRLKKSPKQLLKRLLDSPVLVPIPEFRPTPKSPVPTLKDLLLAESPRFEMKLPKRSKLRLRKPVQFD